MPPIKRALAITGWLSTVFCTATASFALDSDNTRPLSGLNTEQFLNKDQSIKWQDNPFAETFDSVPISALKLFAIIYDENKPAALINRHVVKVGDKIGSAEVVSILPKEVVLRSNEGIFKLSFEGKKSESK